MTVLAIFIFMVLFAVLFLRDRKDGDDNRTSGNDNGKNENANNNVCMDGFDVENLPEKLSDETVALVKNIAAYFDTRFVTKELMDEYFLCWIGDAFSKQEGWSIWDSSVHKSKEQYYRIRRADNETPPVLFYSQKYKIAVVKGKSKSYLTSHLRCSCPDYRERRLPCKHMYALFFYLSYNKKPSDHMRPLWGLSVALAGRFPGPRNSPDSLKGKMISNGIVLEDTVYSEASALIVGESPSSAKIERAKYFDMEIIPMDMMLDILDEVALSVNSQKQALEQA